jgi:hypothetical protein
MPSKPRTPRNTLSLRRLPKVGDEIMMKVKVTAVWDQGPGREPHLTVMIPANGHKTTGPARDILGLDDEL